MVLSHTLSPFGKKREQFFYKLSVPDTGNAYYCWLFPHKIKLLAGLR